MSKMVESTIDDDADDSDDSKKVPLPNVKANVLAKVIDYCTHYKNVEEMTPITTPIKSPKIEEVVQQWYADFVKDLEKEFLFELVTAANYMDIKPLLDLTCLAVSVTIQGKTAPEMRAFFNINEDFNPDEDAARRNNDESKES
jgi:S-phase kinase-associated protein 1